MVQDGGGAVAGGGGGGAAVGGVVTGAAAGAGAGAEACDADGPEEPIAPHRRSRRVPVQQRARSSVTPAVLLRHRAACLSRRRPVPRRRPGWFPTANPPNRSARRPQRGTRGHRREGRRSGGARRRRRPASPPTPLRSDAPFLVDLVPWRRALLSASSTWSHGVALGGSSPAPPRASTQPWVARARSRSKTPSSGPRRIPPSELLLRSLVRRPVERHTQNSPTPRPPRRSGFAPKLRGRHDERADRSPRSGTTSF